jgi:hypothetical protein
VADKPARAVLSADTTRKIEDMQVARWRAMTPAEKARLISSWSRLVDAVALAGIRQRYPHASDRECFLRLAMLKLGRDLAQRAYPELLAFDDLP